MLKTEETLESFEPLKWPKTERGRFLCSKEHPMPSNAKGQWEHTNAHEVGEQENGWPGGDIVRIKCDDCGETWKTELPQ